MARQLIDRPPAYRTPRISRSLEKDGASSARKSHSAPAAAIATRDRTGASRWAGGRRRRRLGWWFQPAV